MIDLTFKGTGPLMNARVVHVGCQNVASPTASATTTYFISLPPGRYYIYDLAMSANTVPVSASGTLLATFYKYDAVNTSAKALNSPTAGSVTTGDLESIVTKNTHVIPVTATLDSDRIVHLLAGDSLYVDVVSTAAIGTAATNLCFSARLAALGGVAGVGI